MRKLGQLMAVALTTLALGATACDRREGPAEEAGEAVDDTLDEAGDRIDEATDR